ncbi:AraC family transcriptional regulator [Paenibacillus oceani]|uniref:AraC family transcriptional regulator n=1 Tax=Paenibacillus oceani TaxID=2772510 RepID=A0A927H0K2_9BACL|nr:AraC family transcriptional regulator [Paenibacillus oceani]MBD2863765.1 AraC family transcriptional regulator [Paenibacillus oceani]
MTLTEQAKQHLRTTDIKLKDMLAQVGYVDQANFNRKFKRAEGLTPLEYRTMHRQTESIFID